MRWCSDQKVSAELELSDLGPRVRQNKAAITTLILDSCFVGFLDISVLHSAGATARHPASRHAASTAEPGHELLELLLEFVELLFDLFLLVLQGLNADFQVVNPAADLRLGRLQFRLDSELPDLAIHRPVFVHVVDEDASDHRREMVDAYLKAAYRRIARPETTTTWVLEAADATETIIEQSAYYGLTVIGAPTRSRLRRFVSGSTNRSIRNNARSVILSAQSNSASRFEDSE